MEQLGLRAQTRRPVRELSNVPAIIDADGAAAVVQRDALLLMAGWY